MQGIIVDTIIASMPIGALAIDHQGEIVLANEAAAAILGYPVQLLLGGGWGLLFLEQPANEAFNQVLLDVIWQESRTLQRTVTYTRPDGRTVHLAITSSFLREDDAVAGIVVLLDDITDIKTLHLKEKAWLEEKNRLHQEKAAALLHLAMAVAHQVRNPTVAIGGMAQLIQKKSDPHDPIQGYCQHIQTAARRLEAIVQAVEIYVAVPPAKPRWFPAPAFFQALEDYVRQVAASQDGSVSCVSQISPVQLYADPELLRLALQAIIDNALEHMAAAKRLEMIVAAQAGQILIQIRDSGAGIPPANLPFVFDPFFTTKVSGIGMGLCLAKKIIIDHRGTITLQSDVGKGTTVTIYLPQTPSSDATPTNH
ncbi:MAG: sensor histidine kinase [Desulfobacca sp.]|uniref:sensor histidine kinase n=1 Tax=Desulfobacca sp. TaxID=2067990 RepID=UPI0040495287